MADPITSIKRMEIPEETIREHQLEDVAASVSDNKDAVMEGIQLLSSLHESGFLQMANAMVVHKEEALENVMGELNKDQYTSIIENLGKAAFLLGDLEMDDIQYFVKKINHGLDEARTFERTEPTKPMDLLKALKDPEINKSITMLLQFLRGMGK